MNCMFRVRPTIFQLSLVGTFFYNDTSYGSGYITINGIDYYTEQTLYFPYTTKITVSVQGGNKSARYITFNGGEVKRSYIKGDLETYTFELASDTTITGEVNADLFQGEISITTE